MYSKGNGATRSAISGEEDLRPSLNLRGHVRGFSRPVRLLFMVAATVALVLLGTVSWTAWRSEPGQSKDISQELLERPPLLVTKGEDMGAVVRSFVVYQQWMLEHPEAADVNDLYPRNSVKGRRLASAIEGLVDRGEHFDCIAPPRVTIVDEPVPIAASPRTVRVLAHVQRDTCQLLDSSNRELTKQPGYVRRAFNYTLQRSRDRWYLLADDDLGNA